MSAKQQGGGDQLRMQLFAKFAYNSSLDSLASHVMAVEVFRQVVLSRVEPRPEQPNQNLESKWPKKSAQHIAYIFFLYIQQRIKIITIHFWH